MKNLVDSIWYIDRISFVIRAFVSVAAEKFSSKRSEPMFVKIVRKNIGCFYELVVIDCFSSRTKVRDDLNENISGTPFEINVALGVQAVVDDIVLQNQLSFSPVVPVATKIFFERVVDGDLQYSNFD